MDRASVSLWEGITEKANVKWIPHGVDTEYFHPSVNCRNTDQVSPDWFSPAITSETSRPSSMVVHKLSRLGGFRFDLISNSPEVKCLASSVPGVHQHERLLDDDYRSLLQDSDLLLLPLRKSTVCNTVLEALACGVPVATTRGGIEDYLDSSFCEVVAVGDEDDLCQAVHKLLARGQAARVAAREMGMPLLLDGGRQDAR